jgi:hypothetical protein
VISAERGLVRAFYPEHISCLADADPIQDPEYGLVCQGCGAILGFPGESKPEPVATPQEAHDAETLGGQREIEPEPLDDPNEGSYLDQLADAMDTSTEAAAEMTAQDNPPWDEPETRLIAHEPVINDMPPTEESDQLPAVHGSVEKSAVIPQDPIMAALDVIDPTRPYTPAEVESQLIDLEARLERGQHFQRVWEERAYRCNMAFTLANAKATLESNESAADRRKADALMACKQQYEDKMLADMMVKAVRETMHNLRSQLSGFQSIARSVGASISGPHGYRT